MYNVYGCFVIVKCLEFTEGLPIMVHPVLNKARNKVDRFLSCLFKKHTIAYYMHVATLNWPAVRGVAYGNSFKHSALSDKGDTCHLHLCLLFLGYSLKF